jgi:hypothetical protein
MTYSTSRAMKARRSQWQSRLVAQARLYSYLVKVEQYALDFELLHRHELGSMAYERRSVNFHSQAARLLIAGHHAAATTTTTRTTTTARISRRDRHLAFYEKSKYDEHDML